MTSSLKLFKILCYIKQIDSKLPCVCSVIDHSGGQNVVRTKKWQSNLPVFFLTLHLATSQQYSYRIMNLKYSLWNSKQEPVFEKNILFYRASIQVDGSISVDSKS